MIIGIRSVVRRARVGNTMGSKMDGYDYLITHLDSNCQWPNEWIGRGGIEWDEPRNRPRNRWI